MTKLLTLLEVADRLRRTEPQMRWLMHSGKAPRSALIGGRRMFLETDVEAYIEDAFEKESA